MKVLSEKKALARLKDIRESFAKRIRDDYEYKALSCLTCTTPGACCLDAHFVNVHISTLEAVAIRTRLGMLPTEQQAAVTLRIDRAISEYGLSADGDTFEKKFACPLFEKGVGCLVHDDGKPVACTVHACYENENDLPPDEMQCEQERKIDDLNARTYGRRDQWLPLPLAIKQ